MTTHVTRASSAPPFVTIFTPILKRLLRAGVPLGLNGLVTIRGRTTGLDRTTPVAIINVDGRRWIWAPWGEVHWVLNLRAARRARIRFRGRVEEVSATELDPHERVAFFRDVMLPLAKRVPLGMTFIRVVDGVDLDDPEGAAEGRVVFELHPMR